MQFDSFEKLDVKISETDTAKRLSNLHKGFESSMSASYGNYYLINESSQESLAAWIGENSALNSLIMPDAINAITERSITVTRDMDGKTIDRNDFNIEVTKGE